MHPPQIIAKVLLPEALPGLVAGVMVTFVSLIGYSAMAGVIGGGGLGDHGDPVRLSTLPVGRHDGGGRRADRAGASQCKALATGPSGACRIVKPQSKEDAAIMKFNVIKAFVALGLAAGLAATPAAFAQDKPLKVGVTGARMRKSWKS